MKKIIVLGIFLFQVPFCFAQALKFKEAVQVKIADKANSKFPVLYTKGKAIKKTNVTYNANGDTLSYQVEKVPVFKKTDILDSTVAQDNGIKNYSLAAEIQPKAGYLMVHFYPIEEGEDDADKVNRFFENNQFAIQLPPRENLKFSFSRFHAGVLTLPLKVYLGSRAPENTGNVSTDANVGLYFGCLFGGKRYVKLPSEEEYRVYEYGWSINGFAGINKLDITETNTLDTTTFQGSLVSSSLGVNVGWHYKTFSIFTAIGFDVPLSDKAEDWVFKGKPWIGFGAGFEIF
ncbi:hypothetical protein [Echinicola vietnamensis]|uniref:Outer membrane protein beta-barrel domain-containing protein n=1 Tax=Echinicola vietnamensis (strain DSM 17526 / LMG 23754 / KMM 6221) TaxID=926556 RepID=L0FWC9_ECHVK|nr:hypothetical protein [Echinicola vietnamensis]AGA78209.1 hypothetical protein Echvi_1955 [Echinicola vietnamensis DSM 17526]